MRAHPLDRRCSGVLLHLTSLPGPHGHGDLGTDAHRFAQFLSQASQRLWQMLPVGPPGAGNSPYASPSSFAGSASLISLELLARDGWLDAGDLRAPEKLGGARAQYAAAARFRVPRLRAAFERFEHSARHRRVLDRFVEGHPEWLPDHALFYAVRRETGGAAWPDWDAELRLRRPAALRRARQRLAPEVRFQAFVQYQFDRQWKELRRACHEQGVWLLGDVPMYVAHDSVDVWANQDLFQLDRRGHCTAVAGVPPDAFSRTGQLWGNPLYRWDRLEQREYGWWIARLRRQLQWFDAVRLDHFIGLHRYWRVPAGARTAARGRFVRVAGARLLERLRAQLGGLPFVAEDLGLVVPPVEALRDRFGLPGMRVLQFGFDDEGGRTHQPHRYPRHTVAYTGTHDNDTITGWLRGLPPDQPRRKRHEARSRRRRVLEYAASDGREPHWDLIRCVLMSSANTTIFPLQDLLGLDSRARMNTPGTAQGNWEWRLLPGQLTTAVSRRMSALCHTYERSA